MKYPHSLLPLAALSIGVTGAFAGRLIQRVRAHRELGQLWAGSCPQCGFTMPYFGNEATLYRVWYVDASLPHMLWRCDHCAGENVSRLTEEAWDWFRKRKALRAEDVDRNEMTNPISFDELHDFITEGGLDDIESAFVMTNDGVTCVARRDSASKTNSPNREGSGKAS